jgi:hypothetical protein
MTKKKDYPYALGAKITITKRIFRRTIEGEVKYLRVWVNQEYPEPVEVTVIGYRTLSNGYMITDEDELGDLFLHGYVPDMTFTAILVVEDLYTNPYYVTL